jgi:diacylglycerol kinase family enzyme
MTAARIPIIINPAAGGGRLLRAHAAVDAVARACDVELEWWPTNAPGHGEELARVAAKEGRPLVLAYGGDGTYNEVARGLLGSATAMGTVPGGTTSVLAYELAVPRPAERAIPALVGGSSRPMRVGRTDRDELFLLMLSAGPDSLLLTSVVPRLKRLGGRAGIGVQAVVELLRRRPLPRLLVDTGNGPRACGWAIVGKSRCYGGPRHAAPGADPFQPSFELIVQRSVGRWPGAGFALGVFLTGTHVARRDVERQHVDRVRLESADSSLSIPYQIDGDVVDRLPVEAWIDPEPLLVRVP